MRSIISPLAVAWLCACTGELPAVDARVASDGREPVDAPAAPDASGPGPDARAAVTIDVVCQPYTRTVVNANGTRQVSTYRYGVVDSVGPEDDFAVMTCGASYTPPLQTCPVGATCTGSNEPPGESCIRAYRSGQFIDGKLAIYCGQTIENFAADGTPTGSTTYAFSSIRVTTY